MKTSNNLIESWKWYDNWCKSYKKTLKNVIWRVKWLKTFEDIYHFHNYCHRFCKLFLNLFIVALQCFLRCFSFNKSMWIFLIKCTLYIIHFKKILNHNDVSFFFNHEIQFSIDFIEHFYLHEIESSFKLLNIIIKSLLKTV